MTDKIKYQIWEEEEGCYTLALKESIDKGTTFFSSPQLATCIHSFEAENYEEAVKIYENFLFGD